MMRTWLISVFLLLSVPAAANPVSPSNVVLNAYLALKAEMSAVESNQQDPAAAVARSQSYFWDYERITRSAVEPHWGQIEQSENKWELISAVGRYLNYALSRLMGSAHAVADVTVQNEALDESGEVAVVISSLKLRSGEDPIEVYFYLHRSTHGWKIFNFSAPQAGFHLYQNVRSNVAPALRDGQVEDAVRHLRRISDG